MKSKFKRGDKVKIPTTNPISWTTLEDCSLMCKLPKNQDFVYVNRVDGDEITLGKELGSVESSFRESDLELYNDEPNYEIY